jgi:hypothetical protein
VNPRPCPCPSSVALPPAARSCSCCTTHWSSISTGRA